MIITISGRPGSGKSTIAKAVAEKLGLTHYSTGDFLREMAMERGMTLPDLNKLAEKDRSIDYELDKRQEMLGKEEDNFIIDSRIGFHFIPRSVKIFLDVSGDAGAERIFSQKRKEEKENTSVQKTKEAIKKRIASERLRYKKYYNIDYFDMKNYDAVVDTSYKTIENVVDEVIKAAKAISAKKPRK